MNAIKNEPIQRVLGFDFGERRIGIASGQRVSNSATPLATLASVNNQPDWRTIKQLVDEYSPDALVVGWPTNLDGSHNKVTALVGDFCRQLEKRFDRPVLRYDERLSSIEAKSVLTQSGKARRHDPGDIDKIAAAIIVQGWLENQP